MALHGRADRGALHQCPSGLFHLTSTVFILFICNHETHFRVHTAQQPIGRIALICNGRLNVERLNCWFAFRDFRISAHIRGFIREYRQLSVLFGDMSDVENSVHFGSLKIHERQ